MSNRDNGNLCAPIVYGVDGPILPLPEKRSYRDAQCIWSAPHRDMHDDPIVVTEPRPGFRRILEIDRRTDPLFLYAQCGDLEKTCRVDSRHPALDRWSAPTVDLDWCADFDLNRIGR